MCNAQKTLPSYILNYRTSCTSVLPLGYPRKKIHNLQACTPNIHHPPMPSSLNPSFLHQKGNNSHRKFLENIYLL